MSPTRRAPRFRRQRSGLPSKPLLLPLLLLVVLLGCLPWRGSAANFTAIFNLASGSTPDSAGEVLLELQTNGGADTSQSVEILGSAVSTTGRYEVFLGTDDSLDFAFTKPTHVALSFDPTSGIDLVLDGLVIAVENSLATTYLETSKSLELSDAATTPLRANLTELIAAFDFTASNTTDLRQDSVGFAATFDSAQATATLSYLVLPYNQSTGLSDAEKTAAVAKYGESVVVGAGSGLRVAPEASTAWFPDGTGTAAICGAACKASGGLYQSWLVALVVDWNVSFTSFSIYDEFFTVT